MIKTILVSQPKPNSDKSPFYDLAKENDITVDFREFIEIEEVNSKDFRSQRINLSEYPSIIFTGRTAVDNYFRIAEEMRYTVPVSTKYFCTSEAVAHYLQKYTQYRKRKIFFGERTIEDLGTSLKKHKADKFLLPLSDIHKESIPNYLKDNGYSFKKAILYRTVCSDLSDLKEIKYDVLVFYSPSSITSLLENFPDFEQNDTKIAAFGSATAAAVKKAGLRLDIKAPTAEAPSLTMAIEHFIDEHCKATT